MSGQADINNKKMSMDQIMDLAEFNWFHEGEHLGQDVWESRINQYAYFLQDGDFELWQPFTQMSKTDPYFLYSNQIARYNHLRTNWMLNRFTTWGSNEWFKYVLQFDYLIKEIQFHKEILKGIPIKESSLDALRLDLNSYKDPHDLNNRSM
jgi:hypothetical protein